MKYWLPLAFIYALAGCETTNPDGKINPLPTNPTDEVTINSVCADGDGDIIVPNLLGSTARQAQTLLNRCGLELVVQPTVGTQAYEPIGTIGSQFPYGGDIASQDGRVTVFVSRGFYVPNLVGWNTQVAEQWLQDLRLSVKKKSVRNSRPAGTVISHTPSNADLFNSGTSIELLVSEGLWVDIPNLEGIGYGTAKNELEALKLDVVHGGGPLDTGRRPINVCEVEYWYPVVSVQSPNSGRLFEGDQIRLTTRTVKTIKFQKPIGVQCP